jgi:hypothetical protein
MNGFQVRTTAKYKTLCLRCFRAVKVGQTIVQEENARRKVCAPIPSIILPDPSRGGGMGDGELPRLLRGLVRGICG